MDLWQAQIVNERELSQDSPCRCLFVCLLSPLADASMNSKSSSRPWTTIALQD